MASLWEIIDPSSLQYDTQLGFTAADSGERPPNLIFAPSFTVGWIRTGNQANAAGGPGAANCSAWTTNSTSADGSEVALPNSWLADSQTTTPWVNTTFSCNNPNRVWCVEDYK